MTPEEARMIEKEQHMSRDELLMVILAFKKKEMEDNAYRNEAEAYKIENTRAISAMQKDYNAVLEEVEALRAENRDLKAALAHTAQVSQLRANEIFGRGTEKLADIIDAAPAQEETDEAKKEPEDGAANKHGSRGGLKFNRKRSRKNGKKRTGKREDDFSNLQRKDIYRLDAKALDEKYGEGNWRISFWHNHPSLQQIPSSTYVLYIHTPVISVGLEHFLVTIPYEAPLWQRSLASPSIVAWILYLKYFLSIPLYRQALMFMDLGFSLSRQTMSVWVLHFAFRSFGPVCDFLMKKLLMVSYHQCDETTFLVNKDGRDAGRKSYMWVHTTSELAGVDPIIVFCFELTRETEHLRKFYQDFNGYITCDAYCSYQVLSKEKEDAVIICGCMMHMRRRFVESLSLIDKSGLDDEAVSQLPEMKALTLIGKIYDADEPLKALTADERKAQREKEVCPLVNEYFQYIEGLDTDDPMMGERLKDAVNYSINQKEYLSRFLSNGNIPADNGFAERCIRPFSVFRSNVMFCDSVSGAKATAIMFSIVETARANGANVYWYLRYILEKMPHEEKALGDSFLEKMMPWSQDYREYEKLRTSQGPPELGDNELWERPRTPRKQKKQSENAATENAA